MTRRRQLLMDYFALWKVTGNVEADGIFGVFVVSIQKILYGILIMNSVFSFTRSRDRSLTTTYRVAWLCFHRYSSLFLSKELKTAV